jgi:autotransporter-associated beta strand protein
LQDAPAGQVSAFMDYFSQQGSWSDTKSPRYYDLAQGNIHWFALSSDPNETLFGLLHNAYNYTGEIAPGLTAGQDNLQNSPQGQWLTKAAPKATAPWKIVMFHNPPFVSSQPHAPYEGHYSAAYMQWGFENLGVDVVISGHAHAYERLYVNDCSYIVCGSGGTFEALTEFLDPPLSGSVVRVANRFGFMTGQVTATTLELLYVVVNAADEPGPQETLDRCILLKGGTLGPADLLGQITSIVITQGGGSISSGNTSAALLPGALLGPGTCTKLGYGTLTLSGSNGFSGTLAIRQGTVQLAGSGTLASGSAVALSGGKLDARGVMQGFSTPLQVPGSSLLELDAGTQLAFADSSKVSWPNGRVVILGTLGTQSLRFGTSASGLTAMQCRQIRLGTAAGPGVALDAQGYVFNPKGN